MQTNQATETCNAQPQLNVGNPATPGNPFKRRRATLFQALVDAVTPEHMQAVAAGLIARAEEGHVPAAKLLFEYVIGKPGPAPEPDRMDADEWNVYKEAAPMKVESAEVISAGVPEAHLQVARMMRPLASQIANQQLLDIANEPVETPVQKEAREKAEAAAAQEWLQSNGPELAPQLEKLLYPDQQSAPNGFNGGPPPAPNGFNGDRSPAPNGFNGDRSPSPNGFNGGAPSSNGRHRGPNSAQ